MEFPIEEGTKTYVTLHGRLDFKRAPLLIEELKILHGKAIETILFKCRDLTYVSSPGIRAILYAQQKLVPDVTIIMKDVCRDVEDVLDMSGLSDFIQVISIS